LWFQLNKVMRLDYNKGIADSCDDNYVRFNPLITTKRQRYFPDFDAKNPPALVCYPKLVAGMGYLSEHCDDSSKHGGLRGGNLFCNHARGLQFFSFRSFMLGNLQLPKTDVTCSLGDDGRLKELQVIFAMRAARSHGFADEKVLVLAPTRALCNHTCESAHV
jgi:hypothetical protein